ncbi:hypothetical protein DXK93_01200 [Achromobacter sp. K91]|uniref:Tc toxin subunit A-related protein n=1 Tax=Achromobacter sp. K91 TaxID=2292262 RepID=UPI000E66EA04|nr:neuraminidase-like domain-containing protein [Achromobacter sp. K91]RIJ06132.1 hypothetical protein DXK93_01200 [Achromobacter sp. K91]
MTVNIDQILGSLMAHERDALAAVFRGMVSDNIGDTSRGTSLQASAEDAYQFLLMDLETSWEPTTTRVATAIASLQQYISGALCGIEPGYQGIDWTTPSMRPTLDYWNDFTSQYDTWAAQTLLQTYPENYLLPILRPSPTEPFQKLVTNVNQGQVNDNTTANAIQQYLNDFEDFANLTVLGGYIDGFEAATPAMTNGYFDDEAAGIGKTVYLGRTAASPYTYCWRLCNHWLYDKDGYPAPNAWTEWEKIDVAINDDMLIGLPRIVQYNERIFLVWFERQVNNAQDSNSAWMVTIRALCAYRRFDGTWSGPQILSTCSHNAMAFSPDETTTADPLFAYDSTDPGKQPRWSTAAFQLTDSDGSNYFYAMLFTDQPGESQAPWNSYLVCQVDAWMNVLASTPELAQAQSTAVTTMVGQVQGAIQTFNGNTPITGALSANLTYQQRLQTLVSLSTTADKSHAVMTDLREVNLPESQTLSLPRPLPEMQAKTANRDGAGTARYQDNTIFFTPPTLTNGIANNDATAMISFTPGINATLAGVREVGFRFEDSDIEGWYKIYLDTWTAELYLSVKPAAGYSLASPGSTVAGVAKREFPVLYCNGTYLGKYNNHPQVFGPQFMYGRTISSSATSLHISLVPDLANGGLIPPAEVRNNDGSHFYYDKSSIYFGAADDSYKRYDSAGLSPSRYIPSVPLIKSDLTVLPLEAGTYSVLIATSADATWPGEEKLLTLKELTGLTQLSAKTTNVKCTETKIVTSKHRNPNYYYTGIKRFDVNGTLVQSTWRRAFWSVVRAWPLDDLTLPVIDENTSSIGTAQLLNPMGRKQVDGQKNVLPNIRLNTLFTSTLINDANLGLNTLYRWDTQLTPEPSVDSASGADQPMDFHGANSLYFWELFYHTPALTAYTLKCQAQYIEALKWQSRIFDPRSQVPVDGQQSSDDPMPNYWKLRPIAPAPTPSETPYALTLSTLADPYTIGYRDPVHFRANAYMEYIGLLISIGDTYYRMLTPDSLSQALQYYTRAHNILGERPYLARAVKWSGSISLSQFSNNQGGSAALVEFETNQDQAAQWSLHPYVGDAAQLSHSFADAFSPPINTKLMNLWDTIDARRNNLRHNLDINGNPIHLAPYATPLNPEALLWRQASNGTLAGSVGGVPRIIPPYRYSVISSLAQKAVGTLIGFGQQLLSHRGSIDARQQEVMQQSQLLELWTFTKTANQQAIDIAQGSLNSLSLSLAAATDRQTYYKELIDTDLSLLERSSMDQVLAGQSKGQAADALSKAGAAADMAPNVFGLANGGMSYGALLYAAGAGLSLSAQITLNRANQTSTMGGYQRRSDDWKFQLKQIENEIQNLNNQIETQNIQLAAAQNSKSLSETQHRHSLEMYTFLNKRYTNEVLYQWLAGQIAALYHQAYDAAVGLCLLAQTCWQYELGDFKTSYITGNEWNSQHQGQLAGETLQQALSQMESAWYSSRNARQLEITRTISVKHLLGTQWTSTYVANGDFTFNFDESLFHDDYPSHYMRRIAGVSITLPAAVGPLQNVRATLQQTSSTYVCSPDATAVAALIKNPTNPGTNANIITNSGASQQVVLSSGVSDTGLFVFQFGDERYLPFEGTGAVSSWRLVFQSPSDSDRNSQSQILASLDDIIVTLQYTACDGGPGFASAISTSMAKT